MGCGSSVAANGSRSVIREAGGAKGGKTPKSSSSKEATWATKTWTGETVAHGEATWASKTWTGEAAIALPPLQLGRRGYGATQLQSAVHNDGEPEVIEEAPGKLFLPPAVLETAAPERPGSAPRSRTAPLAPALRAAAVVRPSSATKVRKAEPIVLSKQQQEQAAKMAERRQRFEARRAKSCENANSVQATAPPPSPPGALCLDRGNVQSVRVGSLPGNLVEDVEDILVKNTKLREKLSSPQSDASTSPGLDVGCFDDDEETLMRQILATSTA